MRRTVPIAARVTLTLLLIGVPLCATAQQGSLLVQWSSNATEYRGQNGRRVTVICPPHGSSGDVYGTDVYTDDSLICPAAVHAGVIGFGGGVVTFAIAPGESLYRPTSRNGVTTRPFGAWRGSFTFDRSGTPGQVEWRTTGRGLSTSIASIVTVACPPNGELGTVWGTDRYTDDSSICSAAVHAGVIGVERGGVVALQATGEQAAFAASSRNGVRSRDYGAWPGGFSVSAGTAARTAVAASGNRTTISKATAASRAEAQPAAPVSGQLTPVAPEIASVEPPVSPKRAITTPPLALTGTIVSTLSRLLTTPRLELVGTMLQPSSRSITTGQLILTGSIIQPFPRRITTPTLVLRGK